MDSLTDSHPHRRIDALTGIRAVAAFLVYCHHFPLVLPCRFLAGFTEKLGEVGSVGVGIFFVLSGFLISFRYMNERDIRLHWWLKYIKNRAARIYPVYFLILLFTVTILVLRQGKSVESLHLPIIFTLSQGFFNRYRYTGIPQAWTLTVEECFYFTAPLIFLCFRNRKGWVPFLFVPLIGLLLVKLQIGQSSFMETVPFLVLFTFFGRIFEFYCGIWLARLLLQDGGKKIREAKKRKNKALTLLGLSGFAFFAYLLGKCEASPQIVTATYLEGAHEGLLSLPGIVINNAILPLFTTLFFAGLILEQTSLKKMLSCKTMVLLGQSSYVFYLLHEGALRDLLSQMLLANNLVLALIEVLLSICIFKFFEQPLNTAVRGIYE